MSAKFAFFIIAVASFACAETEPRHRHPDVGLNAKQLIEKYEYPFENHTVQTQDGYLLEIHRIPYGRNNTNFEKRPVVLLMSGLLCSSADWVNMGPERSLGFILADQGYDVWLANYRGTTRSRKHITLNPDEDKKEYWGYSFHEIGIHDLKEFIDYILHVTKQENLFYIGHSQGTTSFLALLSVKPEYNKKIRLATALAPVVYVEHMRSPFIYLLATFRNEIEAFVEKHQFYEILPHYPIITVLGQLFCNDDSPFQGICASIFFLAAGYSPRQLNRTMIPVITSNTPAGSSVRQYQHYAQLFLSNSFHQYDYGETENLIKYGQPIPPEYDISKVTSPLVLYYGSRDILCSRKDVDRAAVQLPNVIKKKRLRGFNHLDYMWGIDAVELVFNDLIEIMKGF